VRQSRIAPATTHGGPSLDRARIGRGSAARIGTFEKAATGFCLCLFSIASAAPASGQAITAESLQGSTIVATVNYEIQRRRGGEEFSGPGGVTYRLNIAAGGTYSGSVTRTTQTRRGPITATQQFSGTLGRAREAGGAMRGHVVWMLSGNTLRMLRTYEIGGKSTTITFGPGGRSCSVHSPFMREAGAGGAIRREAIAGGGTVDITSAKQTSSSCHVTRG
jgi:hypothetical protein